MEKIKAKWEHLKTKLPEAKLPAMPRISFPSKPKWLPTLPSAPKMPEIRVPERLQPAAQAYLKVSS